MKRLRVFHLTTGGNVIAGAEQLLIGIARLADRTRWDLAFCSLTPRDKVHEALDPYGWPVRTLNLRGLASLPRTLQRLRTELALFRPDIVHAHLSHATILAAVAAMLDRRIVIVQTRHYSDYVARFRKRRLVADAWAARRCDRIIAVSEAARNQLVDAEHVESPRVSVIDNGVEWDRLSTLDHAEGRRMLSALGVPPGPTIGCAATFNVRKGHTYLLQAMVRVRARHPGVQLALLGTGDDEGNTRDEVARLGLSECVHFLGYRADAHAILAGLDVYVQPSVEEGFGLALIEAMAMRRPVVATAVGGMLQTVDPNRTGLRVPPADPVALADALVALLDDPARGAELGRNASENVREHYSLQRMLDRYDDVYRLALAAS
jgi:glycosyltransferase involved in cell wall biosynthesis